MPADTPPQDMSKGPHSPDQGRMGSRSLDELIQQNRKLRDRLESLIAESQKINEEFFRLQQLAGILQAQAKPPTPPQRPDDPDSTIGGQRTAGGAMMV